MTAPTISKIPERARRGIATRHGAVMGGPPVVVKCTTAACDTHGTIQFRTLAWRWSDGHKPTSLIDMVDLQIDHIHPRLFGGSHELPNLQVLCRHCNASKGAKV